MRAVVVQEGCQNSDGECDACGPNWEGERYHRAVRHPFFVVHVSSFFCDLVIFSMCSCIGKSSSSSALPHFSSPKKEKSKGKN